MSSRFWAFETNTKTLSFKTRGGSSPKILEGIAPSAPSTLSPFSPFSETEKIRTSYRPSGLHLKSIISRVTNSVMENLHFGTFWDLKNHVRTVSKLLNLGGGQQVNLGARAPCPNVDPPLFKTKTKTLKEGSWDILRPTIKSRELQAWKDFAFRSQ